MLISVKPKRQHLYYIYHLIINQKKFNYGCAQLMRYYLKCLICRKKASLKKLGGDRSDYYLHEGEKKLARDLDIVSLIRMVKSYNVLRKILFNHDQRIFLKF